MMVDSIRSHKGRIGKRRDDHAKWALHKIGKEMDCIGMLNIVSGTSPRELTFYDDVTGARLDTELVITARAEEMSEFRKHGVYKVVKLLECLKATGQPPIGV